MAGSDRLQLNSSNFLIVCPFLVYITNDFTMRPSCEIASEFVSSKYSLALFRDPIKPPRFLPTLWR